MFSINFRLLINQLIDHLKSPVIRLNVRKVAVDDNEELDNKDYLVMNHGSFYMLCAIAGTITRLWLEN